MNEPELERLLAQTTRIRALARGLVRNVHDADDLAQDAWLAALERDPPQGAPRAWFAAVLRNLARQRKRSSERRSAREQAAARHEVETEREFALCRTVVDAVCQLPDPQRATILLRYFEDRPPREIARIQGVPVKTVNSRLRRALARLREELSRPGPDGRRSLAVLAPLLFPSSRRRLPLVLAGAGGITAVALVVGLAELLAEAGPGPQQRTVASPSPPALEEPSSRSAARLPASSGNDTVAPALALAPIAGRVLDATGSPVANARVEFVPSRLALGTTPHMLRVPPESESTPGGPYVASSDDAGRYLLLAPLVAGLLSAQSAEHATLLQGEVTEENRGDEHLLIVARPRTLEGFVRDEVGAPVAGAVVMLRWPSDLVFRFPEPLPLGRPVAWKAVTDEDGAWTLPAAPVLFGSAGAESSWLQASHDAFEPGVSAIPTRPGPIEVLVARSGAHAAEVRGYVLDGAGGAIPGAFVTALGRSTSSDAGGAFVLGLPSAPAGIELVALAPGQLPSTLRVPLEPDDPSTSASVLLHLDRPAPHLVGRVVDEGENAVPGAWVWIVDPTPVGAISRLPILAENLIATEGSEFWRRVETGPDGAFDLGPALERGYRVAAMDPVSLARAEAELVPGAPGRLLLPRPRLTALAGVVSSPSGAGLDGVHVAAETVVLSVPVPGSPPFEVTHRGPSTRTGADGRFSLAPFAPGAARITVSSGSVLPRSFDLEPDSVSDLSLVVSRRAYLRVVTNRPESDGFAVLDPEGRVLTAFAYLTGSTYPETRVRMRGGRSAFVAVSEQARTVVLLAGERELARTALTLDPDAAVTIVL